MSNSVWPHRRQPTRLPSLWDSSGKNTGVGCHFLLQCMKVKSESEVAQSHPTLSDPMDYSPPALHPWDFPGKSTGVSAIAFSSSLIPQFKSINSSLLSLLYVPTLTFIHDYWKNHSFNYTDLVGKVMSVLFNMLSRFVIAFLPRSKRPLISCLWSPTAVISEPKKIVCHYFHRFLIYLPWSDWTSCHDLSFLNTEF